MKKYFIVCALLSFFISGARAQVDSITSHSGQNKPPKSSSVEGKGSTDGCLSDACGLACSDGCAYTIEQILVGAFKLHSYYLKQRKEIPEVVSFEMMPHLGYAEPQSSMFLPRIRGNWGLFSTDLRLTNMIEYGTSDGTDYYNTLDWQILELNLLITKPVIFRIGSGIMYEFFSQHRNTFLEHYAGVDVNWKDHQFIASGEGRIAPDYETNAVPRIEANFRVNYRIKQTPHMNAYAMAGFVYQNYYRNNSTSFKGVEVWVVQTGLSVMIH